MADDYRHNLRRAARLLDDENVFDELLAKMIEKASIPQLEKMETKSAKRLVEKRRLELTTNTSTTDSDSLLEETVFFGNDDTVGSPDMFASCDVPPIRRQATSTSITSNTTTLSSVISTNSSVKCIGEVRNNNTSLGKRLNTSVAGFKQTGRLKQSRIDLFRKHHPESISKRRRKEQSSWREEQSMSRSKQILANKPDSSLLTETQESLFPRALSPTFSSPLMPTTTKRNRQRSPLKMVQMERNTAGKPTTSSASKQLAEAVGGTPSKHESSWCRRYNELPLREIPDGVIRNKKLRRQLHGYDCQCCSEYYDDLKLSPTSRQQRIDETSRHRAKQVPPEAPVDDHWSVDFPSTPECFQRGYIIDRPYQFRNEESLTKHKHPLR